MQGEVPAVVRAHRWRAGLAAAAALALAIGGDAALARKKPVEPPAVNAAAAAIPTDLFGAAEIGHPPATDFAKWTETLARYEQERREERARCDKGDCALVDWRSFLAGLAGEDALAQLRAVNAYLNRLPYRTDLENYGTEDYWATPAQLFAKGGDCEDYAIAKYLSLRALGWPAERLRVVVIHDKARDLVHAALIAYHAGNAYLLDIEIAEVTAHRSVSRYLPIFSISENGWWSYRPAAPSDVAKVEAKGGDAATAAKAAVAAEAAPLRRSPHMRHKQGRAKAQAPNPAQ